MQHVDVTLHDIHLAVVTVNLHNIEMVAQRGV
jgi:hypothetical protein